MNHARCLITGCALLEEDSGTWCWGDLHEVGESYVFVAVPERGEVWQDVPQRSARFVAISGATPTLQQRNVFVFPKNRAELSPEADRYVAKGSLL